MDVQCAQASTVLGGGLDGIAASAGAVWHAAHPDNLILCQQRHFDDTGAPKGTHSQLRLLPRTRGSQADRTGAIEVMFERFYTGHGMHGMC
jgi:hypothetical protein